MIVELKSLNDTLKRSIKKKYGSFDKKREDIVEKFYKKCAS